MDIIKVILTALLSVAVLFIITKIMGHKQVSQLDFFDYISGITIGSIGAEFATVLEKPRTVDCAFFLRSFIAYVKSACTQLSADTKIYQRHAVDFDERRQDIPRKPQEI